MMSDSGYLHYIVAEFQILHEMYLNPSLTLVYQRDIFSHKEALAIYDAIRSLFTASGQVTEADILREANKLNELVTYDTIRYRD
jgi:hypothetical protein